LIITSQIWEVFFGTTMVSRFLVSSCAVGDHGVLQGDEDIDHDVPDLLQHVARGVGGFGGGVDDSMLGSARHLDCLVLGRRHGIGSCVAHLLYRV
jgi:hypothetical protein